MPSWNFSISSIGAGFAKLFPKSNVEDLRSNWMSVRHFFHMVEQSEEANAELKGQIPDLTSKFEIIAALLREERKLHEADGGGRAVRAEVFEGDDNDNIGYFVHACTYAKTAHWPELKAAVIKFLVDIIVAADAYDGVLLQSPDVVDPLVDVLGNARSDLMSPHLQEAVSSMIELLCRSATSEPKVLDAIQPLRVGAGAKGSAALIVEMATTIIDKNTSSQSLQRSLNSFAFILLARPDVVGDTLLARVIKSVVTRMGQQLVTVCSFSTPERRQYMQEFLEGVRFLNFLLLATPRVAPLVRPPLMDMADRLAQMLTTPNDTIFCAASAAVLASARASSQLPVRRIFALVLLREPVTVSLMSRMFDPDDRVSPSAILALAGAFELVPTDAYQTLVVSKVHADEVPKAMTSTDDMGKCEALDPIFGEFLQHQRMTELSTIAANVRVPALPAAAIRTAPVVKMLCERLATAYEQPDDITTACVFLCLSILAIPSGEIWTALITGDDSPPLAAVIHNLAHHGANPAGGAASSPTKRTREALAREGSVKAMLGTLRSELIHLHYAHRKALVPITVARVP
jgi:hypothetical protein